MDYIGGVIQGVPICFDAKETASSNFPLKNIHEHQIEYMEAFEAQKGVAFVLVWFSQMDEFYYLPFGTILEYWNKARSGGRKSIPYEAFSKEYKVVSKAGYLVHYLEAFAKYISTI